MKATPIADERRVAEFISIGELRFNLLPQKVGEQREQETQAEADCKDVSPARRDGAEQDTLRRSLGMSGAGLYDGLLGRANVAACRL